MFYTFTGQEDDDELGLYNYKARLYDPVLGRFISPDSIVPNPEDPQSFNRYSYCLNNPLKYTDPSGHENYAWGYDQGDYTAATLSSESGMSGATDSSGRSNSNFFSNLIDSAKDVANSIISYAKASFNVEDGKGYTDVNVTTPVKGIIGVTGGVMKGHAEDGPHHAYTGIALVVGGPSVSNTVSNANPESGVCVAIQGSYLVAVQIGYCFGEEGGLFGEFGFAWGTGLSVSVFGVTGPIGR